MGSSRLDVVGIVLRVRRVADLSQRDLAQALGVSQPTVARWESGRGDPTLGQLQDVLALAGLRLTARTEDGTTVRPVDCDVVRDNADRRFPAHLDVVPPDEQWRHHGSLGARHDRRPPRGWYAMRARRDADNPGAVGVSRPPDHPTEHELAVRERYRRQVPRVPSPSPRPLPVRPPCTCAIECEEGGACPESCRCQCEPGPWGRP
jgi:transcriptional regulator with XRE-family HTH domain